MANSAAYVFKRVVVGVTLLRSASDWASTHQSNSSFRRGEWRWGWWFYDRWNLQVNVTISPSDHFVDFVPNAIANATIYMLDGIVVIVPLRLPSWQG